MIQLIVSDIDGTLIPYGCHDLPRTLFPLVAALGEKGVLFAPASGRQYQSLKRLFAPVIDRVCVLCENGAVIFGPERDGTAPVLSKSVMPRADAEALSRDIAACPGLGVLISGENTSYICGGVREELARDLRDRLGNNVVEVEGPGEVPEEIVKVSAFCPDGTDLPAQRLAPRWGRPYNMAVAGPDWLDFTLANKGTGLRGLCAALGIGLEDVMAFGDNWNDVPMLELAGYPYLMDTAHPGLKRRFPRQCSSVEEVLEELLAAYP